MTYDYHEFGAYEQYMAQLHCTPAIDIEREAELLNLLCTAQEPSQRETCCTELVERYQRLVFSIARRYQFLFKSLDILDIVQEGNIGLLQAIEDYTTRSSASSASFAAFARVRIKGVVLRARYSGDAPMRLPENIHGQVKTALRLMARSWHENGRKATHSEIAFEMGISEAKVADLLDMRRHEYSESLDALMTSDDGEHMDSQDFTSLFLQFTNDDSVRKDELEHALQNALDALSEREREVVRLRYGLDCEVHFWSAIAECIGVKTDCAPRRVAQQAEVQLFDALKPFVLGVSDDSVVHPLAAITPKPAKTLRGGETANQRTLQGRRQRDRMKLLQSQPSGVA